MKLRIVSGALLLTVVLGLWASLGQAGDDKGRKKFLPAEAYKELLKREARTILELAGKTDAESLKKGQAAALMAAGCTWAVKEGEHTTARATALALALFVKNKKETEVKKYAAALATGAGDQSVATPPGNPKDFADLYDLMIMFKFKSKGGDGLPPELQLNKKLKTTQNGIEELIRSLSRKSPEGEALDRAAKELELLSYRVAVNGSLCWYHAPKEKAAEWQQFCVGMRDGALDLAENARKKNSAGIVKSATRLNDACNGCHDMFRK